MAKWIPIPLDAPVVESVDEEALQSLNAALENAFINRQGNHTSFPGLREFATTGPGHNIIYRKDYRGDMIVATTQGKLFRVDRDGNSEDVTEFGISGGQRPTFTETEDDMIVAAGGDIVQFAGDKTKQLSEDAPKSTHVVYSNGYLVALEKGTGRAQFSSNGVYTTWPVLNIFAAESKPDDLVAAITTPFNELLLIGTESVEQHDPSSDGDRPWFRRWGAGVGVIAPYTFVSTKLGNWGIDEDAEFARYVNQVSKPVSDDVQRSFDKVDDWRDAWATELVLDGNRFILIQMPYATNPYGTKGLTYLFHQSRGQWSALYGFDSDVGLPTRWPGWSHARLWDRHFVGGEGKVYELTREALNNDGIPRRYLYRTGHGGDAGEELRIDDFRIRLKRGATLQGVSRSPRLLMRYRRDNSPWTGWISKDFGLAGKRNMTLNYGQLGTAANWQFEWQVTDDVNVEFVDAKALIERV